MPIYLCKPGLHASEPWRHAVQVYSSPVNFELLSSTNATTHSSTTTPTTTADNSPSSRIRMEPSSSTTQHALEHNSSTTTTNYNQTHSTSGTTSHTVLGTPIRRIRHAEVVLVDQVSIHYNCFWLRLRWPGPGGVAGYISLGSVVRKGQEDKILKFWKNVSSGKVDDHGYILDENSGADTNTQNKTSTSQDDNTLLYHDDDTEEEIFHDPYSNSPQPRILFPSQSPTIDVSDQNEEPQRIPNSTKRIYFPSASAMELLASYNDGLSSNFDGGMNSDEDGSNEVGDPVFCRICREGLHDVNSDYSPEVGGIETEKGVGQASDHSINASSSTHPTILNDNSTLIRSSSNLSSQLPIEIRHPYAENPLLAPCECSGSMAFVHYLCIEQWRCRSHHPEARNGLNCETCHAPYSLPPPPTRRVENTHHGDDDLFVAMPPHVLAALRRPHPWWQLGAAVVQRRWLRPFAPILMSPIVALYCRSRRYLKKRGVSRRRWACSLCRRRARWKCVRCLRSYYCSRQCQNFSWHIVHKHVCYKPARFMWSSIVYGVGTILLFPGILKFPLIYDWGLGLLWLSFVAMGIIGGGFASVTKKVFGWDIRGRGLEFIVVILTFFLASVSWNVAWAYFGEVDQCWGVMNTVHSFTSRIKLSSYIPSTIYNIEIPFFRKDEIGLILQLTRMTLFKPCKVAFTFVDEMIPKYLPLVSKYVCNIDPEETKTCQSISKDIPFVNKWMCNSNPVVKPKSCLQMVRSMNPDFFLSEYGGGKCGSDIKLVISLWMIAGFILVSGNLSKRRERVRRAAFVPDVRRRAHRIHQD